jgi:hypothetical protein
LSSQEDAGPWNPGILSPVPADLRHLCTIFRPDNVFTSLATADELHDLTGIPVTELVSFRPQRLALHELLIRVTADFAVADGSRIEDLGINFRQITRQLLTRYVDPEMDAIVRGFSELRQKIAQVTTDALSGLAAGAATAPAAARPPLSRPGLFTRFAMRRSEARAAVSDEAADVRQIGECERMARSAEDGLTRAVYRALARVMSALFNRHGGTWGARSLIASLATDLACNDFGSDSVGQALEPLLQRASLSEHYYRLPRQDQPIVMNTKGPSAAGKSSLRPLQRRLAGDIGVRWSDFALISPDIWRKQLLDYQSLGAQYKYAGAMTADELQIIDQKLDRYMARKNQRGEMSHLLIDRFRFDSFAPYSDEAGSNLLTRFGQTVYLFFLITPPESLVERAWNRGLEFGRYKAVGDTLAHSVEAYSGMPDLFFTWVRRADKAVHFEFLDNSVRLGERPRTVAFGDNTTLQVLDVKQMLDIERYRRVNVAASAAESLYPDRSQLAPEHNIDFLQRCVQGFREVNFADQATGRVYLRMLSGTPAASDRELLRLASAQSDTGAALRTVAPGAFDQTLAPLDGPEYLNQLTGANRAPTLGQWGRQDSSGENVCA